MKACLLALGIDLIIVFSVLCLAPPVTALTTGTTTLLGLGRVV